MQDGDCFQDTLARASFDAVALRKIDCFRSSRLFVGLNCLAPGQSQRPHRHDAADKFYLVLRGKARITVGRETREAGPGMLVWAPAGEPHGIEGALEPTVILVAMAPPPLPQSEQSPSG